MITKNLIELLFSAASMQRWNDHPKPVEFTELDKQAHKMLIAYVLAKLEEDAGGKIDWNALIEGCIFEFIHRLRLTDLRPDVFHRLMAECGRELNEWVFDNSQAELESFDTYFFSRFKNHFRQNNEAVKEKRILHAAHYLATKWEFRIIYNIAPFLYGIDATKATLDREIEKHTDLACVQRILADPKLTGFIDLCGQLRFQQRWAQSPRIPKTSVLGHMLLVAMLGYFFSVEAGVTSKARLRNNFLCGLFHDLPEVLTKDIISPIKASVGGLGKLISDYESRSINEKILPLLPPNWHNEIRWYVTDEFSNRLIFDNKTRAVKGDLPRDFDKDAFNVVDGELIEACDKYAAFIEASLSIQYGIRTPYLTDGLHKIYKAFAGKTVQGIAFQPFFDHFYPPNTTWEATERRVPPVPEGGK